VSNESAWELSDGLPGDFDAKIADCQFTFNARYNSGQSVVCQLVLESSDPEVGEETILYSMGEGWEPGNKGQEARWVKDGKQKINKNSALGKFITAATNAAGDAIRTRGMPWEAKTWQGLEFHWDRETYTDLGGKERSRLLPTRLVGSVASNGKSSSAGADGPELPPKVKTALMKVAAVADTHEAFVEAALAVDGVTDEMRPAILSTQEGSIWATMKG